MVGNDGCGAHVRGKARRDSSFAARWAENGEGVERLEVSESSEEIKCGRERCIRKYGWRASEAITAGRVYGLTIGDERHSCRLQLQCSPCSFSQRLVREGFDSIGSTLKEYFIFSSPVLFSRDGAHPTFKDIGDATERRREM